MAGRLSIRNLLSESALPLRRRPDAGRRAATDPAQQNLRSHERHRLSRLARTVQYRMRFLGCLAASLLIMIAVAHIPMADGWPTVGWYVVPQAETISVDLLDAQRSERGSQRGVPVTRLDDDGAPSAPDGEPLPDESAELITKNEADSPPPIERISGRRVFEAAHDMPQIVGGIGAYYIHIEYPEEALLQGIEGRLLLSFVVETDGRTSGVEVIRTLHPACDSAAVRALRRTRFVPGRQDGEIVPVRMHLPVRFKIVDRNEGLTTAKGAES